MKWISVAGALPKTVKSEYGDWEISGEVLVATEDGKITIASVERDCINGQEELIWADESGNTVEKVTHWMPLPTLPITESEKTDCTITELAKQERARYFREWRRQNPDKVRANNQRYWAKRAEKIANGEA